MRLFAAGLLLFALSARPALAQDGPDEPFKGPIVTAIIGVDLLQQSGDATAGLIYGGQFGYDWQSGHIVLGVEGEIEGASNQHCALVHSPTGVGRDCDRPGRDFYAGGRIGRVVGESMLFYAKAGYTNARISYEYRPSGAETPLYMGSYTKDGIRIGVGVEKRLGDGLTLKTEYRYSNYDSLYRHQLVLGLGWRF